MVDDQAAGKGVQLSLMEIAVIIAETFTGVPRVQNLEPKEIIDIMLTHPMHAHLARASTASAVRIADYLKLMVETHEAMKKIGAA